MFDKWLKIPAHYWLRVTALVLLVIGIAISNVLMSIGAIWIISNWLIEADFKTYKKRLKENLPLQLILLFLLYSILSVIWSDDFWYAFHDMRIKLPLLAIPLALGSGKELDKRIFYFLIYILVGIVCFTSLINYIWYHYFTDFQDIRKMSWFISQIRFALLLNLAFFGLIFLFAEKKIKIFIAIPILAWIGFYIFKAQIVNGYILFLFCIVFTLIFLITQIKSSLLKLIFFLVIISIPTSIIYFLNSAISSFNGVDDYNYSELDFYTENGNPYFHDTTTYTTENGHFVWLYVCVDEIRNEWNKRSEINYDSLDRKGQPMYGTAMRYLTSKNLRKDSIGVWSLTEKEINEIENGKTNVNMNNGAFYKLHETFTEYELYKIGADPNGSSLMQRIEHLKTAKDILKSHWLLGVGIGDVNTVFKETYHQNNTKLLEENQLRSHNQFLTSWIGLGLFGIIVMVGFFITPFFKKHIRNYFSVIVLMTLFTGMLFEDMLETQAGATIFALFYSLAFLSDWSKTNHEVDSQNQDHL